VRWDGRREKVHFLERTPPAHAIPLETASKQAQPAVDHQSPPTDYAASRTS
jgi:hypothetical protein